MPRYLYSFIELFSYMGDGTPQNPGGDFHLWVWVEVEDVDQARAWGKRILEQFVRERYRYSDPDIDPRGFEGEFVVDAGRLELARKEDIPVCKVGEIPLWTEPWKHCRASGPPRKFSAEGEAGGNGPSLSEPV